MRLHGGQALGVTRDLSSLVPTLAFHLPSHCYYQFFTPWFPPSGHTLGGRVLVLIPGLTAPWR